MTSVTKPWAFGLILLTTLLTTLAQFFLKTGVSSHPLQWPPLIAGVVLYAVGAAVMILALKGGQVSRLYPVIATSYVWVALISQFWLHEDVHALRWMGIAVIILGVIMLGFSSDMIEPQVL